MFTAIEEMHLYWTGFMYPNISTSNCKLFLITLDMVSFLARVQTTSGDLQPSFSISNSQYLYFILSDVISSSDV